VAKKKKSSKKGKLAYKDPGPQEYDGYKVGQEVFCKCISDGKLGYGAINQIHLKTKEDIPCFTFICQMRGSYQLSYFSDIIDNPKQSHKDRRNRDRMAIMGVLGGKIPRRSKKK